MTSRVLHQHHLCDRRLPRRTRRDAQRRHILQPSPHDTRIVGRLVPEERVRCAWMAPSFEPRHCQVASTRLSLEL